MEQLRKLLDEQLEHGEALLPVTGNSMWPMLAGGRDMVRLSRLDRRVRPGDVVLYQRADGSHVLHRVIRAGSSGGCVCCGDHQWWLEKGLRRDQMIGIATEYVRKGKTLTNRNLLYKFYRMTWTWLLRYRKYFFALRSKLAKIF